MPEQVVGPAGRAVGGGAEGVAAAGARGGGGRQPPLLPPRHDGAHQTEDILREAAGRHERTNTELS